MKRLIPLFLFCNILLPVQAQTVGSTGEIFPSSNQLLDKMGDASRNLNYEGVFVFSHDDRIDVMRLLHKSDADGEREKIVSLTGPAREIIRNNHTVTCVFPDTQEVMIERSRFQSFATKLPDQIEAIAGFYQFNTIGSERIADRDTWIVSIRPRDDFRYGYQLWIDKETYLLLKSELRDENDAALEVAMFTQLELHDEMEDRLFAPSISGKQYTWYQYNAEQEIDADAAGPADKGAWRVTWVPDGFRLNTNNEKSNDVEGDYLQHMIYSDGVSMVSIFIEKIDDEKSMESGSQKIGGVNVYTRIAGQYQMTAVGEVPQATVMRIADSVVTGR